MFNLQKRSDRPLFTSSEVKNVLERLARYYGGRARSATRCQNPTNATLWQAKKDAVLKVAENLEIQIEE